MKNSASISELITFSTNALKLFKDDDIVRTAFNSAELQNKESEG